MLGAVGGIIGVLLCIVITSIITSISVANNLGFIVTVDPSLIAFSLLFSLLIGAGAGYYPARQAASYDVVESLRFDF